MLNNINIDPSPIRPATADVQIPCLSIENLILHNLVTDNVGNLGKKNKQNGNYNDCSQFTNS